MTENREQNRKRGWNRTLLELWAGIIVFEFVCAMVGIWFVPDKADCALGLLIGTVTALAMSFHISWSFDKYFDYPQKTASRKIMLQGIIRYLCVTGILFGTMFLKLANPLAAFLGIMGLKIGAYLQPMIHRITVKKYPDPEPAPAVEDPEEVQISE